jgi:Asp-tRNA(Asn)/Glu-tRNA(Gln) amidotransferase C subunit
MTTPKKVDPALAWMFLEGQLAEEEAKRVEKLSDEELDAEMRQDGMDPARAPSLEQLLAKAKVHAAKLEAERPRVAQAVPLESETRRRAPRGLVWLLAAALALGVGLVAFAEGPAIIAYFERPQITPDNERTPAPTPHEVAEKLRDDAMGHCAVASWASCKDKLDEAARLDPAGESETSVQQLRARIDEASRPRVHDAAVPDKPGR